MGDVSIIARRMNDKTVQYGWSGNGGYFKMVGERLLGWYDNTEMIDYLFGLGQLGLLGKPGSENGGESWFFSNIPLDRPHWNGTSERDIFSRIAFVDFAYLYDLDNQWYYIIAVKTT